MNQESGNSQILLRGIIYWPHVSCWLEKYSLRNLSLAAFADSKNSHRPRFAHAMAKRTVLTPLDTIQAFFAPGSIITFDMWASYRVMETMIGMKNNHSTGMESLWRVYKMQNKHKFGKHRSLLDSHTHLPCRLLRTCPNFTFFNKNYYKSFLSPFIPLFFSGGG